MEAIGDALFEEPPDVTPLLGPFDNGPQRLCRGIAPHGEVDFDSFDKTFLVRPCSGRSSNKWDLASAGGTIERDQQTTTERAEEGSDWIRCRAMPPQGFRLVKRPGEWSSLNLYGRRVTA